MKKAIKELYELKKYNQCIKNCFTQIILNPEDYYFYYICGLCFLEMHSIENFICFFHLSLSKGPAQSDQAKIKEMLDLYKDLTWKDKNTKNE